MTSVERVHQIGSDQLARRLGEVTVIDVRRPAEHALGLIPTALTVPLDELEERIAATVPEKDTEIVLYCATGDRSGRAAETLTALGYGNVSSLRGGYWGWSGEGHPTRRHPGLSADQVDRYSRQILLPEVGIAGQRRLLDSRVLVVGAGGLGSPTALYLAAAGVGTIGIVDFDQVETSNLQRQVLHGTSGVGGSKTGSAVSTLGGINPEVEVIAHDTRLVASNALAVLSGYDVIVDGSDDLPTRYLVNDASLHLDVPVVHGAVYRFEGETGVFHPYQGPCYRCLHPLAPPPEAAPSCDRAGVLGAVAGVIGSIQAVETLKLLLGVGDTLVGRLLVYDALAQETMVLSVPRDPDCAACSDPEHPPLLVDYAWDCAPAGSVTRAPA